MFVGWLFAVLVTACTREPVLIVSEFELSLPDSDVRTPIVLPRHLDELLPARPSEYSVHARVNLPESMRGQTLTLAIPHLYARAVLLIADLEMVELNPEQGSTHRSLGTLRFRIPKDISARGNLELTLRVAHTWTQSGWLDTPFRISPSVSGDGFSRFVESFNRESAWFSFATVFVTVVTSLLVFLLDRRQVAIAWFALEAVFGLSIPLFQMGTAMQLFGVYDAVVIAAGVTIALWASVHFTHVQFGLGRPHRVLDVLFICTLLLIASNPGPFAVTHRAGPVVIAFISGNVIYQIYATARLWTGEVRRVHALVLTVSWAALGLGASADQLAWVGLGELFGGLRTGSLGVAAVGLLQAAVSSHDYITTLRHTDTLNLELAERIRLLESKDLENSALNEVLRRQIAARSEQLAHAITRLGAGSAIVPGELAIGSVLEGRYRIQGVLGRGGMGTVYEVERLADKRTFALKVLSGQGGSVEMARFAREAQLVAQLQHPNVVSIVDVDVATNGLLFIVLELVRGKSLREHMDRGRSDRGFALSILRQVALGLGAIHASKILHRDLKPDNILIVDDNTRSTVSVKITDFGVSAVADRDGAASGTAISVVPPPLEEMTVEITAPIKLVRPDTDSTEGLARDQQPTGALTQAGVLIGTPRYMAPETVDSATTASDVFAFGVLAFELLTGRTPYSEPLIMVRISGRPLPEPLDLALFAPDLPTELLRLINACLSADPRARPNAADLARALAREIPPPSR